MQDFESLLLVAIHQEITRVFAQDPEVVEGAIDVLQQPHEVVLTAWHKPKIAVNFQDNVLIIRGQNLGSIDLGFESQLVVNTHGLFKLNRYAVHGQNCYFESRQVTVGFYDMAQKLICCPAVVPNETPIANAIAEFTHRVLSHMDYYDGPAS